ncbi:cysteine hydrolase family protein [Paraburkholderia sp.]|uniref:cysteine hydrolase family protein n=1 Tax=Paraburkholderia sp. TaxID=1926495 RepID=UPI002386CF1B|nr:cysteine hydrolase family protein [Paraburkholderia sp.]MDE1182401.1 cysteine hydrolase family protein [Paraburkholderia sp.]
MSSIHSARHALLIVDMQQGLFNGPDSPYEGERVLDNINQLIGRARAAGAPIFAARHVGPPGSPIEPGSALSQLLPRLDIDVQVDTVFDKSRPSCFFGTGLAQWLDDAKVEALVIVGMKTEYCIDTTCRAAADLGFKPVLIADAHTSMDTPVLPAKSIVAHHNRTLNGPFVKLLNTADFQFQD